MGRGRAGPWYWTAQDCWAATIGGKRVRLANGRSKRAEAEARRLWRELVTEHERAKHAPVAPADPPLGLVLTKYFEHLAARRERGEIDAGTKADAIKRLAGLVDRCGDVPCSQLQRKHVTEWLDSRRSWGATMRHDAAGALVTALRWAVAEGHLKTHPLPTLRRPTRGPRREAIPSPETAALVLAADMPDELRDILTFLHETGCRPGEARKLEARHLDAANGVAVLGVSEHKTGRKTGRARVLYLSPRALSVAARLAAAHPEGPIFLSPAGRPWSRCTLGRDVRRLRERLGLGDEVVCYSMRHRWASDALAGGIPAAMVAELMGHAGLKTLSIYSHLSDRAIELRDAARRVREED